jgi:uroporphyrinogen decarboxylase
MPNALEPSPPSGGRLVRALAGRGAGRPPVWIMRQAGRYLPGYQEIRRRHTFAAMCRDPELAVEISLEPYRTFAFDAVIAFYDILFLAESMGAPLEYTDRGPVFHRPISSLAGVRALRASGAAEAAGPIAATLGRLRTEVPRDVAVLGFAGAPWTLAAYLIEGDFGRNGDRARRVLHADPHMVESLLDVLTEATIAYVAAQADAGADAVQLFDTWAGVLAPAHFERFALPRLAAILAALRGRGVPSILYLLGGSHLVDLAARSGAGCLSLDWRADLLEVRGRVGPALALQGNLDPAALFARPESVREAACGLLDAMKGDPAYIFNLGHGILPDTPVESVRALVEAVKASGP